MKKAFTLAEVMIVLAVIGVLVAILLPTAQNMTPDENLLKFKKANTSLTTAIRELVNSDKYYYDGDLGLDKEGNKIVEAKYFCSTLADILTTKKVECSDNNLGYNTTALVNLPNIETDEIDGVKIYEYADCMCKQHVESGEEIILSDNTIIYTVNPYYHFGSLIDGSDKRLFNLCSNEKRYKFICMDIDKLNEGEDPFGYALRADGKIIYGAKASAWIKKAINNNNEETIIATTDSCPSVALTVTPENDVCKTVVQTPVVTPTPTCTPSENCITCDPSTNLCTECEDGYELNNGICEEMTCELSEGCTECDIYTGNCLACETGYELKNGACKIIGCGDLAVKLELDGFEYCLTKYNIGDDAYNHTGLDEAKQLALPSTITIVTANSQTCVPSNGQYCCWKGTTSSSCNANNGGYSGCSRTLCDWRAAKEACSKITYGGKVWRLPDNNEWDKITAQTNSISSGKGMDGIMLCDSATNSSSARCDETTYCLGAQGNNCYPSTVWSADGSESSAYSYIWSSFWVGPTQANVAYAFSVRCISPL